MFDKLTTEAKDTTVDIYTITENMDDDGIRSYLNQANGEYAFVRFHYGDEYLFAHIKDKSVYDALDMLLTYATKNGIGRYTYEVGIIGYLCKSAGVDLKVELENTDDLVRVPFGIEKFCSRYITDEEKNDQYISMNIHKEGLAGTSRVIRLYRPEMVSFDFITKSMDFLNKVIA